MSRKRTYGTEDIKCVNVGRLLPALAAGVLVAIDVAKEKFVVAITNATGELLSLLRFAHPTQTRLFLALLAQLRDAAGTLTVLMEPTGTYGDAVREQLHAAGHRICMVQPKHTHDMREVIDGVPSSHDAKSAITLIHLHRNGFSRDWNRLDSLRRSLYALLTRVRLHCDEAQRRYGQLEATLVRHWPEFAAWMDVHKQWSALALLREFQGPAAVALRPQEAEDCLRRASRGALSPLLIGGVIDSAKTSLGVPMEPEESALVRELAMEIEHHERTVESLEGEIALIACKDPAFERLKERLGVSLAAAIIAMIGSPKNYPSARAILKATGLNLRVFESGEKHGRLSIAKRGPSLVRHLLYLATLRWLQHDPIAHAWYVRRTTYKANAKTAAVVALMRKLIAGVWASMHNDEEFDSARLFDVRRLAVEQTARRSGKPVARTEPRSTIRRPARQKSPRDAQPGGAHA
jgi:transposase